MAKAFNLYDRILASFDRQPFLALIGAKLESVEEGMVVVSCSHKGPLTQQQGFMNGGVVTTLADVSCGYAALTTMPDSAEVLTVEFKINLLRPANAGIIAATGNNPQIRKEINHRRVNRYRRKEKH